MVGSCPSMEASSRTECLSALKESCPLGKTVLWALMKTKTLIARQIKSHAYVTLSRRFACHLMLLTETVPSQTSRSSIRLTSMRRCTRPIQRLQSNQKKTSLGGYFTREAMQDHQLSALIYLRKDLALWMAHFKFQIYLIKTSTLLMMSMLISADKRLSIHWSRKLIGQPVLMSL